MSPNAYSAWITKISIFMFICQLMDVTVHVHTYFKYIRRFFFQQFILSFKNMIKYYNQSLSSFICFSYCFKLAPRVCAWEYINDDVFPPAIRLNIPAVSLRQVSKSGSLEYFIRLSLDSNIPSTYPPKNEISK